MLEKMQATMLSKSTDLKVAISINKLNYSLAIDTSDDDGSILLERFVIRKSNKHNIVTTITLDHTNGDVIAEVNNGFTSQWNYIMTPITHDERIKNLLIWTNAQFLLPMSMINKFCDEGKQNLELVTAKHAECVRLYDATLSYIDQYERPLKTAYGEIRTEMEIDHNTAPDERRTYLPNQMFFMILSALVDHQKFECDVVDEVDFWETRKEELHKKINQLQRKMVSLEWIKFGYLKEYPINDCWTTLQYMMKLFDNTASYFDLANVQAFVYSASRHAYTKSIITEKQKDTLLAKLEVKTESKWQRNYRIFHDDERLQKALQKALDAGYIHPNAIPVCPTGRQRNFIKKEIEKFLELTEGVSLYEKVNKISPKLNDEASNEAKKLVDAEAQKAKQIVADIKNKKRTANLVQVTSSPIVENVQLMEQLKDFDFASLLQNLNPKK
jgi:hypothetical protein